MPTYSFIQCDVFTNQVFGGNPLAVFPDARGIDDATMQKIAREMNLSETVFVLPPADASWALRRLRIFTPARELPIAGYPVVGTWNMLARLGVVAPPVSGTGRVTIDQELQTGVLPVAIDFVDGAPVKVVMTQSTPLTGEPLDEIDAAAQALTLRAEEMGAESIPLVIASTGMPILIAPIRSREALSRITVNGPALSALLQRTDAHAVYAVTREAHSQEAMVSARMFNQSGLGIGEDPATGIAAGALAAALVHYGVVKPVDGLARFIIEQGVDIGRPSRIEAEVEGERGAVRTVRIGGSAVVVLKGELRW